MILFLVLVLCFISMSKKKEEEKKKNSLVIPGFLKESNCE
jgi:uncharacterized membrane protein YadS